MIRHIDHHLLHELSNQFLPILVGLIAATLAVLVIAASVDAAVNTEKLLPLDGIVLPSPTQMELVAFEGAIQVRMQTDRDTGGARVMLSLDCRNVRATGQTTGRTYGNAVTLNQSLDFRPLPKVVPLVVRILFNGNGQDAFVAHVVLQIAVSVEGLVAVAIGDVRLERA